jgi:rubrerythrin
MASIAVGRLTNLSGDTNISDKARAVLIEAQVWKCSECGTVIGLVKDKSKPPKRCPNRKKCGVLLYKSK